MFVTETKKKTNGFTLVEIVLVCAIVIALAAGAIVVGDHWLAAGRYNSAKADVSAISVAVSQYRLEMDAYPSSLSTLTSKSGQYGPWLNSNLKDPWGQSYQFKVNTTSNTYAIWSYGPNQKNNSGTTPTSFSGDDIGIIGH